MSAVNVSELEPLARARLTEDAYAYLAGGSGDEHTLRWNVDAWSRIRLAPHFLVDVGTIDTGLHLLGHDLAAPILLAPTAAHQLFHLRASSRRCTEPVPPRRSTSSRHSQRSACPRLGGGNRTVVVPAVRAARPWLHP